MGSERSEPHRLGSAGRLAWLFEALHVAEVPFTVRGLARAFGDLRGSDQDADGQVARLTFQLGESLQIAGLARGIDLEAFGDDPRRSSAILDRLDPAKNLLRIRLSNTQRSHQRRILGLGMSAELLGDYLLGDTSDDREPATWWLIKSSGTTILTYGARPCFGA